MTKDCKKLSNESKVMNFNVKKIQGVAIVNFQEHDKSRDFIKIPSCVLLVICPIESQYFSTKTKYIHEIANLSITSKDLNDTCSLRSWAYKQSQYPNKLIK